MHFCNDINTNSISISPSLLLSLSHSIHRHFHLQIAAPELSKMTPGAKAARNTILCIQVGSVRSMKEKNTSHIQI